MRTIKFSEGEYYHLYNRGVDKRKIFMSPAEYKRFQNYLWLLKDTEKVLASKYFERYANNLSKAKPRTNEREPLVAIGAFCLMPNHFHLYVTPLVEGGVSKFMQRLQTAYTMYFNEKHTRSGALFQGTFKAQHVADDRYARYLLSYIHLNPAKLVDPRWKEFGPRDLKKMSEQVRTYPYSSFREYDLKRHLITDPSKFPNYFSTTHDLDRHIDDWLQFGDLETREARMGA